jgi:hypothetical protein
MRTRGFGCQTLSSDQSRRRRFVAAVGGSRSSARSAEGPDCRGSASPISSMVAADVGSVHRSDSDRRVSQRDSRHACSLAPRGPMGRCRAECPSQIRGIHGDPRALTVHCVVRVALQHALPQCCLAPLEAATACVRADVSCGRCGRYGAGSGCAWRCRPDSDRHVSARSRACVHRGPPRCPLIRYCIVRGNEFRAMAPAGARS